MSCITASWSIPSHSRDVVRRVDGRGDRHRVVGHPGGEHLLNFLMHNTTLAEERTCLAKYGESYESYMERIPRYFLFF